MSAKNFDYLMLAIEIGGSRKYRRLTVQERWATVAGVFSLAAKSPVSGALLVAYGLEVTEEDVAEQAGVPLTVARGALAKLKELHELQRDEALGAWVIEDWTSHQPAPKARKPSDSPEATRERKRRSRASVTPSHARDEVLVTPPEEKRREENTPQPPQGSDGVVQFDSARDRLRADAIERVWAAYTETRVSVLGARSKPDLSPERRKLIGTRLGRYAEADLVDAVRGWRHSAHHRGQNDSGTPYCDIELVLRISQTKGNNVEKFRDLERHNQTSQGDLRQKLRQPAPKSEALKARLRAEGIDPDAA